MGLRDIVIAGVFSIGLAFSCSAKKPDIRADLDKDGKPDRVYNECHSQYSGGYYSSTKTCHLKIKYADGKKVKLIQTSDDTTIRAFDRDKDGDIDLEVSYASRGCGCSSTKRYWLRNDGDRKWSPILIVK